MIATRDAGLAVATTAAYVVSASALPAGAFTLSAWIQVRDASTTDRCIFGSSTAGAVGLRWEGSDRSLRLYSVGGSEVVSSAAQLLQPFQWYHVAATFDGTTARLYINGALVASASSSAFTAGTVRVGSDGTLVFSGRLDECAAWTVALSAEEIDAIFTAGVQAYPRAGIFFDYRFDDHSASSITDSSGGGNTGTISGTFTWVSSTYVQPRFLSRDMGLCLSLNGSDERIALPGTLTNDLNGAAGITLAAWARPMNIGGRILVLLTDTGNSGALIKTTASGGIGYWESFSRSRGSDSTETASLTGVDGPQLGRWAHLALVIDYVNRRHDLYHNGVCVARDTSISWSRTSWLGSTQGGQLGGYSGGDYWNGELDELQVFGRALSAAEIRRGYLTGQWDSAGRALFLDWDDGTLTDRSGNGHVLTLTNVDTSNLVAGFM